MLKSKLEVHEIINMIRKQDTVLHLSVSRIHLINNILHKYSAL